MLSKERLVYIINRLQVRPSISVQELSKEMGVSLSTVQRDLRKLEQEGKIERSRGGAISNTFSEILSGITEVAISEKVHVMQDEKEMIAEKAASLIQDGECIFLDSGTTVAHLVPYIMNKNITIVTNSHYIMRKLVGCKGKIYMLGGVYNTKYDMTMGASTVAQMEKVRFDRSFISCNGVDLKLREVYSVEYEIAILKQIAMKRSQKTYLLIDHSKFETRAIHAYAKISDFDYIFCDEYPKEEKVYKNIVLCNEN